MVEQIKKDLENLVNNDDIYIYDVNFNKEGTNNFLVVTIDSNTIDIDLDICVDVTKNINEYLDSTDPIKEEYILEVSSKGIENDIETVEEIEEAVGNCVYIKTYSKVEEKKEFIGKLLSFEGDDLVIECNEKSIMKKYSIVLSNVARIRYSVEF